MTNINQLQACSKAAVLVTNEISGLKESDVNRAQNTGADINLNIDNIAEIAEMDRQIADFCHKK